MISGIVRAGLLATLCAASFVGGAGARTPYDGAWSVLVVTQQGYCDRAVRYGVRIVDGRVLDDGGMVSLRGRVLANGSVQVTVSSGPSRANGIGRMTKNVGSGKWEGVAGSDRCAGYWQANRRLSHQMFDRPYFPSVGYTAMGTAFDADAGR
jgi:hypothetical protein